MTVELAVLTPALFLLAVLLMVFGRLSIAHQEAVEAARAGAEVAAVQPNPASAQGEASKLAGSDLLGPSPACADHRVGVDTSQFVSGGWVRVGVSCTVELSDLPVPGLPAATTFSVSASAPIDPYRTVG